MRIPCRRAKPLPQNTKINVVSWELSVYDLLCIIANTWTAVRFKKNWLKTCPEKISPGSIRFLNDFNHNRLFICHITW